MGHQKKFVSYQKVGNVRILTAACHDLVERVDNRLQARQLANLVDDCGRGNVDAGAAARDVSGEPAQQSGPAKGRARSGHIAYRQEQQKAEQHAHQQARQQGAKRETPPARPRRDVLAAAAHVPMRSTHALMHDWMPCQSAAVAVPPIRLQYRLCYADPYFVSLSSRPGSAWSPVRLPPTPRTTPPSVAASTSCRRLPRALK